MALKFLNKKGWHTGSLRNIENVWKAEQKHDAEEKKLDELRKQIQEERERAEFRLLQEQAGLVPRQERLDFLYDSGLAVGKGSSDGFKALETLPKSSSEAAPSSSDKQQQQQPSVPGALFEDKPQSANDAWRKLHSDPLLLIRQREQEALARVKNNPVQMAMIRKSVEAKKHKEKTSDGKERSEKHHRKKSKHRKHSSPEQDIDLRKGSDEGGERHTSSHKSSIHDGHMKGAGPEDLGERDSRRRRDLDSDLNYKKKPREQSEPTGEESEDEDRCRRNHGKSKHERYHSEGQINHERTRRGLERESPDVASRNDLHHQRRSDRHDRPSRKSPDGRPSHKSLEDRPSRRSPDRSDYHGRPSRKSPDGRHSRKSPDGRPSRESPVGRPSRKSPDDRPSRKSPDGRPSRKSPDVAPAHNKLQHKGRSDRPKLSEEERAKRLREMQIDAELHEEQRWKRIKKAEEEDAEEARRAAGGTTSGKNFLDAAQRSVYGAEKGGSTTIEESVRRRTHYSQGKSEGSERNAFRR